MQRPDGGRKALAVVAAGIAVLAAACTSVEESAPNRSAVAATTEPATASLSPSAQPSEDVSNSAAPGATTVIIRGRSFGPPEINVAVGEVLFVNEDIDPHTITEGENGAAAPDARFDEFVDVGDSVTITFAEPGDYRITCQFHAEMHLLVHVQ